MQPFTLLPEQAVDLTLVWYQADAPAFTGEMGDLRQTSYAYDEARRLQSVTAPEGQVGYTYDEGGLRTQLTFDGKSVMYEYDAKGRLIRFEDWDSTELVRRYTTFSYDKVGRHIMTERPDNLHTTYTYDVGGRLTQIQHQDMSGGTPVDRALFEYLTFDGRGNRMQVRETINGGTPVDIDYTYDGLSRLLQADYDSGTTVYTYGYDVAGNLTNMNGTTRTYNAANQMVNDGTNALTYDNNGNLISDGVTTYTWDRANRLLTVGNHSYVYDGNGDRYQQTVGSTVTNYLLDTQPGLAVVLRESDGTNSNRFIHAPRGIHAMNDGSAWTYHLQDALGSVRGRVDANAAFSNGVDYDPYGVPDVPMTGFAFTGEPRDSNGLQYHRARYYDPQQGMWLSLDPFEGMMQRPMSLNGYSWVEGNVVNDRDPSGKISEYCLFLIQYPHLAGSRGYQSVLDCLRYSGLEGCLQPDLTWDNSLRTICSVYESQSNPWIEPIGNRADQSNFILGQLQKATQGEELAFIKRMAQISNWVGITGSIDDAIGALCAFIHGDHEDMWYHLAGFVPYVGNLLQFARDAMMDKGGITPLMIGERPCYQIPGHPLPSFERNLVTLYLQYCNGCYGGYRDEHVRSISDMINDIIRNNGTDFSQVTSDDLQYYSSLIWGRNGNAFAQQSEDEIRRFAIYMLMARILENDGLINESEFRSYLNIHYFEAASFGISGLVSELEAEVWKQTSCRWGT